MGQQHADRLAREMRDILEVDHDAARQGLTEQRLQVSADQLDGRIVLHLAHLGSDDEHVLDDLGPDAQLGCPSAASGLDVAMTAVSSALA